MILRQNTKSVATDYFCQTHDKHLDLRMAGLEKLYIEMTAFSVLLSSVSVKRTSPQNLDRRGQETGNLSGRT